MRGRATECAPNASIVSTKRTHAHCIFKRPITEPTFKWAGWAESFLRPAVHLIRSKLEKNSSLSLHFSIAPLPCISNFSNVNDLIQSPDYKFKDCLIVYQ